MNIIQTDFIESKSVGYRQIRIRFGGGISATYCQEFSKTEGWFNLKDGSKAGARLTYFIDKAVEGHQQDKRDKIAALEHGESILMNATNG